MLYAKVVFGLPLEGPFDYIVGKEFEGKISAGSRVSVTFGPKKMIGYVVELTDKSKIRNLKKIINLLDDSAILDKNMLKLTKQLSEYYCCSWGEAIETALPEPLRRGKAINGG